jgi:uncharacterized protein (TIGR01244 family)
MQKLRPIVVFTLLALAGGCATSGRSVRGINNFAVVEQGLYRGGQPSKEGIAQLRQQGVKTIINLRDDFNPRERGWAVDAGMNYVLIGTSASRIRPAEVANFLDAMASAPRPIFVHCYHGRDRTGLEIAVYRIARCGWTREAALRELYAHGYQWAAFPGIARFVSTFQPAQYARLTAAAQ